MSIDKLVESVNESGARWQEWCRKVAANNKAITKAVDDATLYGSGFIRVDADGNLQRLDPLRIIVEYKLD